MIKFEKKKSVAKRLTFWRRTDDERKNGVEEATRMVKFYTGGREWVESMFVLSLIQLQLQLPLTCSNCSICVFAAVSTARPLKRHVPMFIRQHSKLQEKGMTDQCRTSFSTRNGNEVTEEVIRSVSTICTIACRLRFRYSGRPTTASQCL